MSESRKVDVLREMSVTLITLGICMCTLLTNLCLKDWLDDTRTHPTHNCPPLLALSLRLNDNGKKKIIIMMLLNKTEIPGIKQNHSSRWKHISRRGKTHELFICDVPEMDNSEFLGTEQLDELFQSTLSRFTLSYRCASQPKKANINRAPILLFTMATTNS